MCEKENTLLERVCVCVFSQLLLFIPNIFLSNMQLKLKARQKPNRRKTKLLNQINHSCENRHLLLLEKAIMHV